MATAAPPVVPLPASYAVCAIDSLARNDFDVYDLLVSKGVPSNPTMPTPEQVLTNRIRRAADWSALHICCASQHGEAAVQALLDRHAVADLDAAHRCGSTALFRAAEVGHAAQVQLLCEAGADVNKPRTHAQGRPHDASPLYMAADGNHIDVVKILLKHGADPSYRRSHAVGGPDDASVVEIASWLGHAEVLQAVIQAGGSVSTFPTNMRGNPGDASALFGACCRGHISVVETLLSAGCDPTRRRSYHSGVRDDKSSLDIACREGRVNVVRKLVEWGCPLNDATTTYNYGNAAARRPIDFACRGRHRGTLAVLLSAGADPFRTTDAGVTLAAAHAPADAGLCLLLDSRPACD